MNLFASVYLDEDVNPLIATLLGAHGFPATTAREMGTLSTSDEAQLKTACRLQS